MTLHDSGQAVVERNCEEPSISQNSRLIRTSKDVATQPRSFANLPSGGTYELLLTDS